MFTLLPSSYLAIAAVRQRSAVARTLKTLALLMASTGLALSGRAASVSVSSPTQSAIVSAISAACNGTTTGVVLLPDGTYPVSSAITIPANCSLRAVNAGSAILLGSQNQILLINGNNVTVNGLILNQGSVAFGWANSYTQFVFTNNTIENIWSGGINGGTSALSGPAIISSNISNNIFSNIWGGGSPGYPNAPPDWSVTNKPCPGLDCWGSGGLSFSGLDQTTISNNTFDKIAGDGMHLYWGTLNGKTGGYTTSGNVISYNVFTHIRRIPMEIQTDPDGNCPGGCNYSLSPTTGLQIKGNYVHDYSFPYYQTWGASIVPDGATNPLYINNTYIANSATPSNGGFAACNESSGHNSIVQGNVCASVPGSGHSFGAGISEGGGSSPTYTSTYQDNVFCGSSSTTQLQLETPSSTSSTLIDRYNYKNAGACPAGANVTASAINTAFTSGSQSFVSGGNGTWSMYVISNLSIRYVQFFLDGASTPFATQELQDVNTNFANDQKWLYHAGLNTSTLSAGTHTLAAVATDVAGTTKTVTQTFQVGASTPAIAVVSVTPGSLTFASQQVNTTAAAQTITLTNSGTATLNLASVQTVGANASDFSSSSSCGSTLAIAASCTMQISFTPVAAGQRTAAITMTDDAAAPTQTIPLTGSAIAAPTPAPSPAPAPAPAPQPTPTAPVTSTGTLPTNLPKGMILWLANDSGVVSTGNGISAWEDQSGSGNHAVQANTANQPTLVAGNNGQSALHFDGSASFLSLPNLPIDGSTGMTVFLVSASANDPAAAYGTNSLLCWPETTSWGTTFFGSYQTSAHFRFGTTQTGNEQSYKMPFTRTDSFGLSEWTHAGTTDSMWFNGQSVASISGVWSQINGAGNSALLGQGMNKTFYSGDVSEVMVYARALTAAERQAVEQYLMRKYHL